MRAAVARGINVGWHAVAGRQCLLGSIRSGAGLEHVMSMLGVAPDQRPALEAAALAAPADAGGIAVHGIGEPECTITGIGPGAAPGHVWRAALEAAGAAAADALAAMDELAGPRGRLVVVGGWADGDAAGAVKRPTSARSPRAARPTRARAAPRSPPAARPAWWRRSDGARCHERRH